MMIIKAKQASTFWQKSLGLLVTKKIKPLFFQTRWGIHTFGMTEPIDVVILDKQRVVAIKEDMKPNSIFLWNPKYKDVLELPKGSIEQWKIKQGSKIKILL